ncbi:MAG TPA: hypothetical protein DF383_08425 [Deltaproteobacteria bacterium]|nr:hypothetical protein [Deltaproteobacteria bacterium]
MSFAVTVIGGTGVFGRYIVNELASSPLDFSIRVTGRRAEEFDRHFPKPSRLLYFEKLDLQDRPALEKILQETDLVILAAGPFQDFSPQLPLMAAERGVHYLDICDDPLYLSELLRHRENLAQARSVILSGLSSLPGISIPLAERIAPQFDVIHDIDIGLFIGNKNQKGRGAVFSALRNLHRPVHFIRNGKRQAIPPWSYPVAYSYPAPIGPLCSYSFASPDSLLFPRYYRFDNLSVRVGFEWAPVRWSFSLFKKLIERGRGSWVEKAVDLLFPFFSLSHRIGSELGCVSVTMTGLKQGKFRRIRASLLGDKPGQRMASLPCVIAAEALARGEIHGRGLLDLNQWMPPEQFFQRLEERNMRLLVEEQA